MCLHEPCVYSLAHRVMDIVGIQVTLNIEIWPLRYIVKSKQFIDILMARCRFQGPSLRHDVTQRDD